MQYVGSSLILFALGFSTVLGTYGRNLQASKILVGFTLTFYELDGTAYSESVDLRLDAAKNIYIGAYEASTPTKNILFEAGHTQFTDGSTNDVVYVPNNFDCPVTFGGILLDLGPLVNVYSYQNKCRFDIVNGDVTGQTIFTPVYKPMTATPTKSPSFRPTVKPSTKPSFTPTFNPTITPSVTPTNKPSMTPTLIPSLTPTLIPSLTPTLIPTVNPTIKPSVVPTTTPTLVPTDTPTSEPTYDSISRHSLGAYTIKIFLEKVSSFPIFTLNAQYIDDSYTLVNVKSDEKRVNTLLPLGGSFPYPYDNLRNASSTFCPVTYEGMLVQLNDASYNIYRNGDYCICEDKNGYIGPVVFEPVNPPADYGHYTVFIVSPDNTKDLFTLDAVWIQDTYSIVFDFYDSTKTNIIDKSYQYIYDGTYNDIKYYPLNSNCPVTNAGISVYVGGQHINIYSEGNKCLYLTAGGARGNAVFYVGE